MSAYVSITDFDVYAGLRNLLILIVPEDAAVVRAQVNRVPEPPENDFVVMTSLRRSRMATTVQVFRDTIVVGSISGRVLDVTAIQNGPLVVGQPLFGLGVSPNTRVAALMSAAGGTGLYEVSVSQTVAAQTMYAGCRQVAQSTRVDFQLDIHGPRGAEVAQAIVLSAFQAESDLVSSYELPLLDDAGVVMTDSYGQTLYAVVDLTMAVLTHGQARQVPFVNDQMQFEDRWVLELAMQINPTVFLPQQFADAVTVQLNSYT